MIAWLSDWLKQIVMLVLIATFLDLLLPNNALDRYVKLVMGLLIILAMLSPVLNLLQTDWDITDFKFEPSQQQEEAMDPLDRIQQEGNSLANSREGMVREQVEQELAEQIDSEITERFKLKVAMINVKIQVNDEGATDGVEKVEMTLYPAEAEEGRRQMDAVNEVDPVIVDLEEKQEDRVVKQGQEDGQSAEVAAFVAEKWEIPADRIDVTVEEGP
ncbi:stage III sporulation protein AF [Desmospora activa]|uniref:Stage III sporulation protein AF n=1 Tax=Desmospora activa DSM 45169 TaxID=1121389 RepID=A0A2T4Z9F1_9BACL|nr:stage III sporulation protein AF [Desmospora activa]PTM58522.1 stage III sporulation protein AF [Desmospora activa DSM 45169]